MEFSTTQDPQTHPEFPFSNSSRVSLEFFSRYFVTFANFVVVQGFEQVTNRKRSAGENPRESWESLGYWDIGQL